MTTIFNEQEIQRTAKLAALNIDERNIPGYCSALSNTFNLINQMQQVNTDNIKPMSHPLDSKQRLRADVVTENNIREELFRCSPTTEAGLILVPQVIE